MSIRSFSVSVLLLWTLVAGLAKADPVTDIRNKVTQENRRFPGFHITRLEVYRDWAACDYAWNGTCDDDHQRELLQKQKGVWKTRWQLVRGGSMDNYGLRDLGVPDDVVIALYSHLTPVAARLWQAVPKRFPGPHGFSTMSQYTMVPYGPKYFAATVEVDPLADPAPKHCAVWETIHGQWSFIFEFDARRREQPGLAQLFAQYHFSEAMTHRLCDPHMHEF